MEWEDKEGIHEDDDFYAEDEEEDEIVAELDVYFANTLSDRLYLFQYPMRNLSFSTTSATAPTSLRPTEGRFKPLSKQFELTVAFPTVHSAYYNQERGEFYGSEGAVETVYDVKKKDSEKKKQYLETQTLSSSVLPTEAKYMVGVIRDGELHLTPISAPIQFRPSFRYIDKITEKEKAAAKRIAKEEDVEDGVDTGEDTGRVVQVSVSKEKADARKAAAQREARAMDDEQWQPLTLQHEDHMQSESLRDQLFATNKEPLLSETTKGGYLDSIDGKPPTAILDERVVIGRGIPLNDMKMLPFKKQVMALLLNAVTVTYTQVLENLGANRTEKEIIDALEEYGMLVNGVWIGKSELYYMGRPRDARDVLLEMFAKKKSVTRIEFVEGTKLPMQMATNMISEIAQWEKGTGWTVKCASEDHFVDSFPDIAKRQKERVTANAQSALTRMQPPAVTPGKPVKAEKGGAAAPIKAPAGKVKLESSKATTAVSSSFTLAGSSSTDEPEVGGSTSGGRSVSAAERGLSGMYIIQGETKEEQLTALVRDVFSTHGIVSRTYVQSVIKSRQIDTSKGNLLTVGVTEDQVDAVLAKECLRLRSDYVLKKVRNIPVDEFRPAIIELFTQLTIVKRSDVNKAVMTKLKKDIPAGVYTKIMKEFANNKGQSWTLKSSPAP
ncbi:Sin-like protein conserved region-domain-containing protein [Cladochytrium replicatum]|nr:Sin-like protein conserved region-domain-containing protein [Cladochytrium replicatum]